MAATKNITLRLSADDYVLVESLAEVEETTVSEVIREAVASRIAEAAHDPGVVRTVEELNRRKLDLWSARAEG